MIHLRCYSRRNHILLRRARDPGVVCQGTLAGRRVRGGIMQETSLKSLARVLAALRTAADVESFLQGMMTPRERERLAVRWQLVRMLAAGYKQRLIVKRLHVSLCNITRGSRELKQGPKLFRTLVFGSVGRDPRVGLRAPGREPRRKP